MAKKSSPARKAAQTEKNQLKIGGIVLAVALVVIAAIIIMGQGANTSAIPAEISVGDAYKMYGQDDVVFVDVREQSEWDEYHAPNTTLIPLGELASRAGELPKDKKIVVVCRSGNRSQQGRDILKSAGFTSVTSMAGGLVTWRTSGFPVIAGP